MTVEKHKARLSSELTRARVRRSHPTLASLRAAVLAATQSEEATYPRWTRVNLIKTSVDTQLETTFSSFARALSIEEVVKGERSVYIDEHVPGLLAVSPRVDLTKTEAYRSGALILQDKASCFPAYLLDPGTEGDVVDACAAPGNKTTHAAAILHSRVAEGEGLRRKVFAFEKDAGRAETLSKMVERAGAKGTVRVALQDFLKVKPTDEKYKDVSALLLDPSCSGSGIVGRDSTPELHLPEAPAQPGKAGAKDKEVKGKKEKKAEKKEEKKRKREEEEGEKPVMVDDEGNVQTLKGEQELAQRLRALSGFQLTLVLHALEFSSAKRVTYSTCSVHAEENESVVMRVLESEVAKRRGWRVLRREEQVAGMREWPVRGEVGACGGDQDIADGCVRSFKGDGRGIMGFFVVAFARDGEGAVEEPYVRDEEGRIVRDAEGMPMLKATGEFASIEGGKEESVDKEVTKNKSGKMESESDEESDGVWGGFDD